jgi:peptide/nickel transport system permease protein
MLFAATSMTYFLASAFLDPRSNYLAKRPVPPTASIDAALDAANINDKVPVLERYWHWLGGLAHWNWGLTPDGASINDEVARRIGVSTQLVLIATILGVIVGVGFGVWTAVRQYSFGDRFVNVFSVLFMVIPAFVIYLYVVLAAIKFNDAIHLRVFYVTGLSNPDVTGFLPKVVDWLQHIALPTLGITLGSWSGYHQGQRTYLLDTMSADYVRTARAKGMPKRRAIRKHALRTSLIPTATSVAFTITAVFTGAVFAETIFAINGLGKYFIDALNGNDINGTVAVAAFSGVCTLAGALLADVVVALLDPRIRID